MNADLSSEQWLREVSFSIKFVLSFLARTVPCGFP